MAEVVTQKRITGGRSGEALHAYIAEHGINPNTGMKVPEHKQDKARKKLEAIRQKREATEERRENAHSRLQTDNDLWKAWLAYNEAKDELDRMRREAIEANREKAARLSAVKSSLQYDLAEVEAERMAGEITEEEAKDKREALEERVQTFRKAREEKLAAEKALPKLQKKVDAAAEDLKEAHRDARAGLVQTLISQFEDVLSTWATLEEKEKDMEIVGMKGPKAPANLPNESALPTWLRTDRLQTWIRDQKERFSRR